MKLKGLIYAFIAVAMLFANTNKALAKSVKTPKIYAFGIAASFNDSTVYITDIQEIDSVWIDSKTKYIVECSGYSNQLRQYFTDKGDSHRTCVFYYDYKKKGLDKKYNKLKAKYVKSGKVNIEYLSSADFVFERTKPYIDEDNEATEKLKIKKNKKEKKEKKSKKK